VYGGDFFGVARSEWDPETLEEQRWDPERAVRRFEEATGATLRDPRDLVELWWALERRRLATARN